MGYEWIWELAVDCQLESIINHPWQNALENVGALIEAWVCVGLDQPHGQIIVQHEVIAKELEAPISIVGVKLAFDCINGFHYYVLDILHQVLAHPDRLLACFDCLFVVSIVQIPLKLIKVKLVAFLILPIVLGELLHRVIGQVHKLIITIIFELVFNCRGAQVALLKEEDFHILIDKHPNPNIKLAIIYQVWFFNVFLDDELHISGNYNIGAMQEWTHGVRNNRNILEALLIFLLMIREVAANQFVD